MLKTLVDLCFSKNGWLVRQNGFRFEPAQYAYAQNVALWLSSENRSGLGLLEGGTGVGKTLAYLIPAALAIALEGKRGVVATHTLSLLDQIYDGSDIDLIDEFLSEHNLSPIKVAKLVGRQHYIDPVAFEHLVGDTVANGEHISSAKELIAGAYDVARGSGYLEQFVTEFGPLPACLDAQRFTLSNATSDNNDAFSRDRRLANEADLVITTHTTLLLNRRGAVTTIFESIRHLDFVICDEADLLPAAAESLSRKKIRPKSIAAVFDDLPVSLSSAETGTLQDLRRETLKLDSLLGNHPDKQPIIFSDGNESFERQVAQQIKSTSTVLKKLNSSVGKKYEAHNQESREILERSQEHQSILESFLTSDKYSLTGIAWSRIRGLPSLEIMSPFPARAARKYFSAKSDNRCKMLFTSATLSNGRAKGFEQYKTEVGTWSDDIVVEEQHEPNDFGSCEYVLTDVSVPKPIAGVTDNTTRFSNRWIEHTLNMVATAASQGTVLCLTVSFSECLKIASKLQLSCPLHVHEPGKKLSDVLDQFRKQGGVLITPSAWEGVSIRDDDGGQMFTELVVTRIPYRPPEPFKEKALAHYLTTRSHGQLRDVSRITRAQGSINATRKLRQGFGRPIRNANDTARIYVCDPRFPLSKTEAISHQDRGLTNAIPTRFWSSYCNATVLQPAEQSPLLNPQLSDEELSWL